MLLYVKIKEGDHLTEWMTIREAAEYLKCSVPTIHRRINSGQLRAYKSGSITRLKRESLDAMLEGGEDERRPE
jgi:excisionase family DNA binding protein